MRVHRGDVVLVEFPYSDGTGSKLRPCVVVQTDAKNAQIDDTIVVMVSSRIQHVEDDATQFLIQAASRNGIEAGVLMDSAVQCANIATIDQSLILRQIGRLTSMLTSSLNDSLGKALGLKPA